MVWLRWQSPIIRCLVFPSSSEDNRKTTLSGAVPPGFDDVKLFCKSIFMWTVALIGMEICEGVPISAASRHKIEYK